MKKYLLLLSVSVILFSSCKKSFDATKQAATDDAAIQAYLKAHNITATKDESGLYYQIVTPGSASHPTIGSTVYVSYVGTELDNTVFDQSPGTSFTLSQVIEGWQIGIPKIGIGGEEVLYVPSALAYGNQASGSIKANTVLIFAIKMSNFTN
jgi:FKBP-type peptidyl-prolyl cis-trans isomerase